MDDITKYFQRVTKKITNSNRGDQFADLPGYDTGRGKYAGIEGFDTKNIIDDTKTDAVMNKTSERNYKVAVEPKTRSVKVEFQEVADSEIDTDIKKLGYLLILAKYNNRLEKIGHVDAKISKEGIDIENYILEHSTLLDTEDKKEALRTLMRNALTTTSEEVLALSIFSDIKNSNGKLINKDTLDDEYKPTHEAYLELLEIIYDAKYYKRALNVTAEKAYTTGISNLYNDLLKVANLIDNLDDEGAQTPTTTFGSTIEVKDEQYDLIQKNANDADKISNLDNGGAHQEVKNFLANYIQKYKSLTMSVGDEKIGNGICSRDGICSYTFENLEDKDANGEFYYYKLGFGLIYNKGEGSTYSEEVSQIYTYKYGPGNDAMYFKLDNSLEEQTRLLKRLAEIEKAGVMTSGTKVTQPMVKDEDGGSQDMEAYMKMLRPHLGNYPSEFTLREQDVRDLSLADYLNKSVNAGTINIGVNVKDTPVYDDTEPSVAEVTD
jgi:hypothetical protein